MSDLNEWCGRFRFAWDMNANGAVTITDIGLLLKFFFLLPATCATLVLSAFPALANFFEVNCDTGSKWGGAIFSIIVWSWAVSKIPQVSQQVWLFLKQVRSNRVDIIRALFFNIYLFAFGASVIFVLWIVPSANGALLTVGLVLVVCAFWLGFGWICRRFFYGTGKEP